MDVTKDLKEMAARAFTPEFLEQVLNDYNKDIDPANFLVDEAECEQELQSFSLGLNGEQAAILDDMKKQYRDMAHYSLGFGFCRGLYAGFESLFVENSRKKPFQELVEQEFFSMPAMKKYPVLMWRDKISQDIDELKKQTGYSGSCLANWDVLWNEKVLGVLRYAFYLGIRCVQSISVKAGPFSMWLSMEEKMLTIEHELGFTKTIGERESAKMAGTIIPPSEWLKTK